VTEDLREFVRIRYSELLRTAYLLTGSSHAAEDLVQTALLAAMGRWKQIDDPMAYLRRAMVNRRATWWRRISSREVLTAVVGDGVGRGRVTSDHAPGVTQRDELLRALGKLPTRMRAVLVLRYWEDLSEIETAEVLGCAPGTVKSQASRGLARLRRALEDTGPPWRAGPVRSQIVGERS
jgi:RNA polymerase sigma-70 factor (sigma-E family)